ncbi:hypothetical protein FGRMN_105 [Fusarium graminum]|nr:hypothetical protein FGRMN_105 [Fusarium graminum]
MKVAISPEKRERPTRAAAPKNMTISDSEEEEGKLLSSPSKATADAAALWNPNRGQQKSTKTKSDDLSSGSESTAIKSSSLARMFDNKRSSSESEDGSPPKRTRIVTLKTNKSGGAKVCVTNDANSDAITALNQAVTPASSHTEVSTQLSAADATNLEILRGSVDALQTSLFSARQATKDAEELEQARKRIALLEQQLKEAQGPKDLQTNPSPNEEVSSHNFRDDTGLRIQNKYLQNRCDDLEKRRDKLRMLLVKERQENKDSRLNSSFKVLDDEVDMEWRRIAFDIRQFAMQILTVEPYRKTTPQGANYEDVNELKKLQKKSPSLARFYFEHYIWKRLVDDIFHAGTNTWGGTVGQAFHHFCLDLSKINFEGMEELSRIKAYTADLLNRSSTQDNCSEAKEIAREMKRTLHIFMDEDRVNESGRLLFSIVRRAVELNAKFLRSKAFFMVNWISGEFDLEDLDIHHTRGERDGEIKLDIEISPRLSKIGNGDGRYFDSDKAMEICKSMVTIVKE